MQFDLSYLQAYTDEYETPCLAHIKSLMSQISALPTKKNENLKLVVLPGPILVLPLKKRSLAKEKKKWELFAAKKGIRKKRSKEIYDEKNDTFLPRYGRFSVNKSIKRAPKEEE